MADEQLGSSNSDTTILRGIDWREVFPFTHLFRAFRIAVHPSKLILALVALLAIYFGGNALDAIWPNKHLAPVNTLGVRPIEPMPEGKNQGIFFTLFSFEVQRVNDVVHGVTGAGPGGQLDPG